MTLKSRFYIIFALPVLCLFASCQGDHYGAGDRNRASIGIHVSNSGFAGTKSTAESGRCIDSLLFEGVDGKDILVEVFESDNFDLPFMGETSTKGSVIDNNAINSEGSIFLVDAWLGSSNRYSGGDMNGRVYVEADATDYHFIKAGEAAKGSSDWTLKDGGGDYYYWRNAVPTTFWSYYPKTVDGGAVRSITFPGDQASDADQNKLSFTYSLGSATTASAQKDLLFAYNLQSAAFDTDGSLSSGSDEIDVHFYHALSAIRFDISGLYRKNLTIRSIKLEGVVNSGACAVEGSSSGVSFSWTPDYTDKTAVSQAFLSSDFTEPSVDVNPGTGVKDPSTLQSLSNGKIYFLIPQTVKGKGVKLTIEYSHSGDELVLTKSVELDHDEAWTEGKYYTYRLSVSGVDLLVDDDVDGPVKDNLLIRNVGADPAYIRAIIVGNWVNSDGEILVEWDPEDTSVGTIDWGTGISDWTKGSDGFYYYKDVVPGGEATSKLFESYTVTSRPSILEDSDYLDFTIVAQSVLADTGKASAIAAWGSTAAGYLN